ncbi:hypothetical protein ABZ671_18940 [Micromonospora sp. NPDC006766]|uniref:hypothetical protein n=1 Tax=Micromonospora sp. NPDC006766 TaxID=3154778 RepID=UPI00340D135F
MTEPQQYRLRPFEVEAMRWQPDQSDAAAHLLGWLTSHDVAYDVNEKSGDLVLHSSARIAQPGWWVIRRADGWTFTLTPEDFDQAYAPIAPPAADPDKPCDHVAFAGQFDINRITATDGGPVTAYSADIRITCETCGEQFRWIGAPAGLSPARPTVSVDETVLHAPIRPASSDPDFGLGIPGFAIRFTEGDAR